MIDSKDISVVVQGPIKKKETKKCLHSIRKFLPEAEIILSTWQGSNIEGLDYDILLLNEDPGATVIEQTARKTVFNNMNRQLLTIKEGLKYANRKYVLKFRSDLILTNNSFLNYFDEFQCRSEKYNLFNRKILTATLFTRFNIHCRELGGRILMPFHISDWWLFGLNEDMNTYFADTPLVKEPEFTKYFDLEENKNKITPYGKSKFKFAPEQYFGYSCFCRNFTDMYMEDATDSSDELMEKFREAFVNNFITLEFKQSGIYLNKYPYSKNERFSGDQYIGLYNFYKYESEYKKYCDKNYEIKTKGYIYTDEKIGYAQLRLYKHISKLFEPNTPILQKLEQIFIGIPVSGVNYLITFLKVSMEQ